MKINKTIQVNKEVIESIICDKCGDSNTMFVKFADGIGNTYGLSATVHGGYESTYLDDCTSYEFDVCEKCLTEWFDTFNTPVRKQEY